MIDRHGSLLLASSTARSSPLRTATLRSPLAPLWTATLLLAFASPALTQVSNPPASAKPQQATASQNETSPQEDDTTLPVRNPQKSTIAENLDSSWSMLTAAATDAKHTQHRVQALAAIGTLGASPRAEKMLTTAMSDPDVDVRTAAVLAAGQSKDRNLTTPLRRMLDDKEPQVAFAAATTLWKMNDRSGEDILMAVVEGERKSSAGLVNGAMHTANEDLHSPSTLARIGALQGASMLLGPFGFGITAYEYIHKNGADSARVVAVEQIAQERTNPIRDELIDALADKDPGVRAAAAKALGDYREKAVAAALSNLFDDPKLPVRLTAAAAYLRANGAAPGVPEDSQHRLVSVRTPLR
jgi:HEAT repeat protein